MGIAAFLCGLFYGGFLLAVYRKAERTRYLDRLYARGMERLLADLRCPEGEYVKPDWLEPCPREELAKLDEGCEWPWGYEELWSDRTDPMVPGVTYPALLGEDMDLSKVIRTGFEDG